MTSSRTIYQLQFSHMPGHCIEHQWHVNTFVTTYCHGDLAFAAEENFEGGALALRLEGVPREVGRGRAEGEGRCCGKRTGLDPGKVWLGIY